jgi:hypothetical protein
MAMLPLASDPIRPLTLGISSARLYTHQVADRWDYLTLTWMHSATGTGDAVQYESKWVVREARAGVETQRPADEALVDVLADLGKDGWELVTETIQSYAQVAKTGFPTATTPLRVRWILKRPLAN